MAKELLLGVTIGATLRAGFTTVFGRAEKTARALGSEIKTVTDKSEALMRAMKRTQALNANANLTEQSRRYAAMSVAIERAAASQKKLNSAIAMQEAARQNRQRLRGEMMETAGHGAVIAAPIVSAVKTFIQQDNAAADLKITMLRANGTAGAFEEIKKQSVELGKELPGTTQDFINLAQALKKQGLSDDLLRRGGLRTSARLNVLMDMDQASGGEFFAKMVEAHGLQEQDFSRAADITQRGYYAFGLKKEDMFESMKYYAPTVRTLDLTGSANYEKLMAIQGMAAQTGLEGSAFGTNFSQMLARMSKGPKMLEMSARGMKKEVKAMMDQSGVKFEFFDKKGNFKGLDAMVGELEKLNLIKEKFGDAAAMDVAGELFGTEAARPALIIAQKGRKGLEENIKLMQDQADLQARIKVKTDTLGSVLEQMGGVAENAAGTFGSLFAPEIKAFAATAQNFIENTLEPFIRNHKGLIKTVLGGLAGFFALKLAILGVAYAGSMAAMPLRALFTGYRKFAALKSLWALMKIGEISKGVGILRMFGLSSTAAARAVTIFSGALSFGKKAFGLLFSGLKSVVRFLPFVGKAFMGLGRFLLMTPIGWALGFMATAAYLLYTRWDSICEGAKFLWSDLSGFVGGVANRISTFFGTAWEGIKGFFNSGIGNISATILNWSPIGLFYQAFAAVLSWFGIDLPAKFTDFGRNILQGLWDGLKAKWEEVKAWWADVSAKFGNIFGGKNEIRSPSRLFMRFGGFITKGLARGIDSGQTRPLARIGELANGVQQRFKNRAGELSANLSARMRTQADEFAAARAGGGAGAMTVHFNPTINAPGGDVGQIRDALQMSLREFEALFKRMTADNARRAY